MTIEAKDRPARHDRLDIGLVVWIVAALFAVFLVTAIVVAWAVRHAMTDGQHLTRTQKQFVLEVAGLPGLAREAFSQLTGVFGAPSNALLIDRRKWEKPHWVRRFPSPEDSGYLLYAGMDRDVSHSDVKLIRIRDGAVIARWDPDWPTIYERIKPKRFSDNITSHNARAIHPLPLANGDVVFNTGSAMVRVGPCSGEPQWVLDRILHHSNELDADGSMWVPGVSNEGFAANRWLQTRVRDDAVARVSPEGKLLELHSMVEILRRNGLEAMAVGMGGGSLLTDPIHLNEIRVAPKDTPYWKKGDLLLSARHLSTVFLYRPSTGKIVWYQTGPWLNQHDADFVDDHRISIFDNNVFGGAPLDQPFLVEGDTNKVFIYDFATHQVTEPYAALLAQAKPVTYFEGRARVLPDGGLFLEESSYGRILRFTPERLLWSFVNDFDKDRVGILSWSRYLTAEEAEPLLKALAARKCAAPSR